MTSTYTLATAMVLLALPVAASAQQVACPQFFPGGQPPVLVNARLAQRTTLLCNDVYAVLASGVTHGPIWSAEHPTAATLDAAHGMPRQGEFHPEDRLPPADQAQLEDYSHSGYDRGHMAPSGDMPDEQAQQQSFSLANMVPQKAELNRGIWAGVESAVRRLATREGELFLVTGPAFQDQQVQSIGSDGVLVPSSTWKAVYDPRAAGTDVYVCSNTATPGCEVVSVAALTHATGINPFPALPARMKAVTMTLPAPEASRYAGHGNYRQRRQLVGLPQQMFAPQEHS